MTTPPTAGGTTETAAPAATTLAASPPPGMTVGTADGATAAAASAADTGVDVDTDPNPAATALPAAEHISSFLLHIRRCADDLAAGPVLWVLLLLIRVLMWLWARLLVSPPLWSPLTLPPAWISILPMIYLLMLTSLIQPRSGVMVMRSQQRYRYGVMPR